MILSSDLIHERNRDWTAAVYTKCWHNPLCCVHRSYNTCGKYFVGSWLKTVHYRYIFINSKHFWLPY